MTEVWEHIPGMGRRYQASDLGRVRSLNYMRTGQIRCLAPYTSKQGYLHVCLWVKGKRLNVSVHRLVTLAFHGKARAGMHAAHLNGCRQDNRAANLTWATPKENHSHRHAHGTYPEYERHPRAKLTWAKVDSIRKLYAAGSHTQVSLARLYGVNVTIIWRVIHKHMWVGGDSQ